MVIPNHCCGFLEKSWIFTFFTPKLWATNSKTNSTLIFCSAILQYKVRKAPDFFRNPVFFLVAEAGLEPTTSGLWAAVYITFSANNHRFGAFLRSLAGLQIRWNLPCPLRDNPVWVKTWVKNVALLWVSQACIIIANRKTSETIQALFSLFIWFCSYNKRQSGIRLPFVVFACLCPALKQQP